MKINTRMMKRCRSLALAGMIGAGALLPAANAMAIGPGESGSGAVITSVGSGGPGSGPSGGQSQTAAGAANTDSSQSAAVQTNPNAWKRVNGVYQMSDGSAISNVLARGIDVSRWQGDIDWNQVASDDVSFVMLGTRSKGAVDPYFHTNIQKASAAGIKVGVYIYSLATTTQMAVEEADFVLNLIHDYPVSYPVAFDMEDSTQGLLSKAELADIANAFCRRISEAGYYPIIYANDNWLANKLDMSLMNYPVWVARYSARPAYQNPVMWQATSSGSVKGISGNVDIDFQFRDFSSVIPANTWRTINGNTYYYQNYVKQKNNWINDGNGWYYMDSEGLTSKGWITLSGKRYYLDADTGKMATGWKQENGSWYYLDGSGALSTGWINDGAAWYYSNSEGVMQTGWLNDGGSRYYLDPSGARAAGWRQENGSWYYFDGSGVLAKGWINDGGIWYYSNSEGVMQTGWLDDGGNKYYLRGSGAMATGWREMEGAWYYFDGSGAMAKGLVEVGGLHYYLDPSTGIMAAGTVLDINGTLFQANGEGVLSPAAQAAENAAPQAAEGQDQTAVQNEQPEGSGAGGASEGTLEGPGAVIIPIGG
ncbi:GH25 family lysozyme [Lacrimispora sp. 210928-DFI.3.58]|uniref:GH25 family lysozyme n=1 Tax=Lacrimispora sp. 210928-DFI.3.58 TaxID=2883214 RepID=UPI001D08C83E|nr:GH25 family lysozyme [Lacrimispora sp. 210928-DFI.3.58]MCB7320232.1 glycoside hydrolase [Lacrimispora sp. 210928-DFI.3.58]